MAFDSIKLNRTLKSVQFPLPFIWDILELLRGKKHIATMDLRAGYHQFMVEERCRSLTAFRTAKGVYQFKRIPFGLTAPAFFQMCMTKVLVTCHRCCFNASSILIMGYRFLLLLANK